MAHARNQRTDGFAGMFEITAPISGTLYIKNTATFAASEVEPSIVRVLGTAKCAATGIGRETTYSPNMTVKELEIGYRELFKVGKLEMKMGIGDFQVTDNFLTLKVKATGVVPSAVFPVVKVKLIADTSLWAGSGWVETPFFRVYSMNPTTFVQLIEIKIPSSDYNNALYVPAASRNNFVFYQLIDALNVASECYFNCIPVWGGEGLETAILKIDYTKILSLTSGVTADIAKYDYGANVRLEVVQDEGIPILNFPSNSVTTDTPTYGGVVHSFPDSGILSNEYQHMTFPSAHPTNTSDYPNIPIEKIKVGNYGSWYEFVLKVKDQNNGYAYIYNVATGQVENTVFTKTAVIEMDGIADLAQMAEVSGLKCLNSVIKSNPSSVGLDAGEGDSLSPYDTIDSEIKTGNIAYFKCDNLALKGTGGKYWLPSWDSNAVPEDQAQRTFTVQELRATEKYHRFIYVPKAKQENGSNPVGSTAVYPLPEREYPRDDEQNGTWYYCGAGANPECSVEASAYGIRFAFWMGFSSAILPFMMADEGEPGPEEWTALRNVMTKQTIKNLPTLKVVSTQ